MMLQRATITKRGLELSTFTYINGYTDLHVQTNLIGPYRYDRHLIQLYDWSCSE